MADLTFTIDVDADDAINSAKNLQDEIRDLFTKPTSGKLENQLDKVRLRINKIITQQEKAKASMAKLETKDFGNTGVYQKVLDKIELYSRQVEAAKKNVQAMEKLGAGSAGFQNATDQLEKYKSWLDLYERLKLRMEKQGKAKISPQDTQEWQNYVNKIENGNNEIRTLISAYNQLLARNSEWGEQAGSTAAKTEKRFSKLIEVIKKIPGLLARGIKNLGKFGSKMLGINKASEKHSVSLKKMINQVLRYGLGIRSLFILWRKLRAYTADALKLMATQFKEVDADVSALMNSFNQMKLSFGTMAQPLMHALRPALIYIIELITRATTALANFFAILTGQKFIYKAQKANDSYADSIKGVGGAAKEANKELAEYDNLLVIDQPKDSGGGGGGGAADGLTGTFEKTLAESDFARQLKEAINRGDWEGVGGLFADKLNIITKTFDNWVNNIFRPKGVALSKIIGRILNGWIDGWDGDLFGRTVGDSLMAVMDIVATFWETPHWKDLGKKVADAVNGLFDEWEPETVGRFFSGKINAAIDFAAGLVDPEKGIKWKQLGSKIGESLKNLIEDIHWDTLGSDLSGLASGILDALSGFIEDSELGVTVGEAINKFLNGINFKELGTSLFDCAMNILNAIADLIKTIDWFEVGQAIADLLASIDWVKLIETLMDVAVNLIGGLAKALLGIASNPKALASLGMALASIFAVKSIWKNLKGVFASGIGDAISSGVSSITKSGGGLFKTVASKVGKFFQGSFGKGLLLGVATFEAVGSLTGSISSVIATLFNDDELAAEYQKFSRAPIKYTVMTVKDSVKAAKEYSETTGSTTLKNAWNDMWSGITGNTTTTEQALEEVADIYTATQEQFQRAQYSWDVMGRWVSDEEWEAFKNSCDDYVAKINELQDAAKNAGDSIEDMAGDILTLGEDIGTSTEKYQYMNDELERLSKIYPQMNIGQLSGIIGTSWDLFPDDTEARLAYVVEQIEHIIGKVQEGGKQVQETVEETGNIIEQQGPKYEYMKEKIEELSSAYSQINPGQLASIISTAYDLFPEETTSDIYNRTKYIMQMIDKLVGSVETSGEDIQESVSSTTKGISLNIDDTKQHIVNSAKESILGVKTEWDNADVKGYFGELSTDITTSFDNVPTDLSTTFGNALDGVKTTFAQDSLTDHFTAVKENIETPFKSLPSFFSDTFKQSWNEAESAFSSGNTTFNNFNAKLSEGMANTINNLIGGLNSAVSGPLQKIQEVINKFKNVKIGASSLFSNLPSFSNIPHIPKLAQGAVIPPNREFLATLGDQTSGTNIETPLTTMVQAFKTALSEMGGSSTNQNIVLQLDGRTVAQCVWDEEDKRYKQTGRR